MKKVLLLVAFLPGCLPYDLIVSQDNYLIFHHGFDQAAAQEVRRVADDVCATRKRVAVQTERACSLERCSTSYQCMDKGDAALHRK